MKSYLIIALLFLACTSDSFSNSPATNVKLGGQKFEGSVTINASPADVWKVLTNTKKFCNLLNYNYESGDKKIAAVGDNVNLAVWGDKGSFVVIKSVRNSELRFVWDPENASYFCSQRWLLNSSGNQTVVRFKLSYTESGPQTPESIAKQVQFYDKMLSNLKRAVENN